MIGSLLPTILWDINEKSSKLIDKNLQVGNYQPSKANKSQIKPRNSGAYGPCHTQFAVKVL